MNKNKFTIQKIAALSCFLGFNYFAFGQSILNNPNPGGQGASCETAYQINVGQEEHLSFQNGQSTVYIDFTAADDSMSFFILEDNQPHTLFSQIDVYEKQGCGNLQLIHSQNPTFQDQLSYMKITNLAPSNNYLIIGQKDGILDDSHFDFYATTFLSVPCTEGELPCGELIRNGDFSYSSVYTPDIFEAFNLNQVCDWHGLGGNPQLVYREGSHENNGSTIADPYAGLWTYVYPVTGRYVESIYTEVDFESSKDYHLSFTLEPSSLSYLYKPHRFKVWLVNQADLDNIVNPTLNLPDLVDKQEVVVLTDNQINNSNTTYGVCFSPEENYDRLLFMAQSLSSGTRQYIHLDKVSLREITAGEDVNLEVCAQEAIQIGPDCEIPGATYSWSPATGLSNPNIAQPIANPSSTTTYTMSVTLPGGSCIPSNQVVVTVTDPIDYYIPHNTNIAQLRTITSITGNSIADKVFKVNGTLIIDEDFTFENCSFKMAEGAKIVVDDADFIFESTGEDIASIMACDTNKFWDGIYVDNQLGNSSVQFLGFNKNILVSNMEFGIVADDNPDLFLINVFFNRNVMTVDYNGVEETPFTVIINDCNFDCTSPLINASGNPFYPSMGMHFQDVKHNNYKINFESFMDGSTYNGRAGSIFAVNSNIDFFGVEFNNFQDMTKPFGTNIAHEAIKIWGEEITDPWIIPNNPKVYIGNCRFYDTWSSIEVIDNVELTIGGTWFMDNTPTTLAYTKAIDVTDNTAPIEIANNVVEDMDFGISLFGVYDALIANNDFDMEVQSGSGYTSRDRKRSVAIRLINPDPQMPIIYQSYPSIIIRDNEIWHSKIGIQTEFAHSLIRHNEIYDLNDNLTSGGCPPFYTFCSNPSNPYGIRVMNAPAEIERNKVQNNASLYTGNQPSSGTDMVGISIENAYGLGVVTSTTNCNNVKNTGIGLRFMGNNGSSTDVMNNVMNDHYYGFALDNNADIGDVGSLNSAAENEWQGNYTQSHTYNYSYAHNPTHFVLSTGGPTIGPNDAEPPFSIMTTTTVSSGNTLGCSAPELQQEEGQPKKQKLQMQNKSLKQSAIAWMKNQNDSAFLLNQQLLYFHLNRDSALYHSKQWKSFVDSMKNTALGKVLNKNTKASIKGSNNFDQNLLTLQPIMQKIKQDSVLNASDTTKLFQIAEMCPYDDGIAVYQARSILQKMGFPPIVNSCEISKAKSSKQIRTKSIGANATNAFKLYPNPTEGSITLEYVVDKGEKLTFELMDALGKKQLERELNDGAMHRFTLEQLPTGLYIYRLRNNDTLIESGKLIVH